MKQLTTVIPAVFNRIRPGATFLSIKNYVNNYDEKANFGLVFHVNYINAVKKAVAIWKQYQPQTRMEEAARIQLINSYEDTLNGYNPSAKSAHVYIPIVDGDKNLVKGVKFFQGGNEVHLWGFVVHRVVVTPGNYPRQNTGTLTFAKKNLLRKTPLARFRQFKIINGRFSSIGVEKLTLTQKDLLRELK